MSRIPSTSSKAGLFVKLGGQLKRGYEQYDYLFNANITLSIVIVCGSLLESSKCFEAIIGLCSNSVPVQIQSVCQFFERKNSGVKEVYQFNPLKTNVNLHSTYKFSS
jgi:hypothetical protein